MNEIQSSAGSAFWAARGVRIEPEPTEVESVASESIEPESTDPESTDPEPFIPTQASFDEVEPQPGVPVDGLVALSETLIDAARAKAERQAKAAEPAWQLTDEALAALPDLATCLEAILLVVDEPVTEVVLAQIVERPTEQVGAALRALSAEYTSQGRGFDLREVGIGDGSLITQTGWRFYTRAECAPVVERYIRDGQQARLTQAALETLAVVAYRQPVSRSKVSAIRGVNCDGVMRTLLARGLVEECGTEYETGALLYRTTGYFLERMGLKGLDELPDLAPLLPSAADMEDEV
jgi:segregation and condensation protein B